MTENGKKDKRTGCDFFGVGYTLDDEECQKCERGSACQIKSESERSLIKFGVEPKIPIVSSPQQMPFLWVTKPTETITEVLVTLRFNKPWLKKLLGWGGNDPSAKGLNAEFIFKTLEKLKKQFANRPEIIAEIEALLNDGL